MRQSWQKSSLINGLQHDEHSSTTDVAYSFEISLSPEVEVFFQSFPLLSSQLMQSC